MAIFTSVFATAILLLLYAGSYSAQLPQSDIDLLEFPLNLEYLEAEFFLFGSLGYGLDKVAPNLTMGGPAPIGGKKANLDAFANDVVLQFAWQEVGHLKAIKKTVKGFPRPLLDLSAGTFAKVMDKAFGKPLRIRLLIHMPIASITSLHHISFLMLDSPAMLVPIQGSKTLRQKGLLQDYWVWNQGKMQ
ncbi:hypothetical protein AB3S75_043967 [Citrus x aurantiifolia]